MLLSSIRQSSEQRKVHSQGMKKELQPLLDPATRAAAGGSQTEPGKTLKETLLTRAQQSTAKPELNLHTKISYRQGKQWHEKIATLNPEKDSRTLRNFAKVLNEEAPSLSKTIHCVRNTFPTDKKTANEFAQFFRREITLPLTPKKVGDTKEKLKQEKSKKLSLVHARTAP